MKRVALLSLIMLFLISTIIYAQQAIEMKIAVASNSKQPTTNVSSLAGRSPYYLIFDNTGKLIEVIENPYKDVRGGAGSSVAYYLAEKGVTIVVAETFGGKMINAMKSKGITYYEFKGIVSNAVKTLLKSK